MLSAPSRLGRLRRPLVLAALLGLAACGDIEPQEARAVAKEASQEVVEAGKDVAQATREVAQATKELTREQLEKVDPETLEKTLDGVAGAMGARSPEAGPAGADPLADAAQAIECDEARTRCTVTADFAARARLHGRQLAEQLGVRPAGGSVGGVRIVSIDEGTLAELVGLKVGDVVTHVNGKPIGSSQDVVMLYLDVRVARRFVIDYRRGSEARTLQLDVV